MDAEKKKDLIKKIVSYIVSALVGAGAAIGILEVSDDGKVVMDKNQVTEKVTNKIVK